MALKNMKRLLVWVVGIVLIAASCGAPVHSPGARIITVSIPPFKYFVEAVAGSDFVVNVMLPQGADHHIWEPLPAQIRSLSASEALVINGQLGFEDAWMERFMQVNPDMKILDLSQRIRLIGHEGMDSEGLKSEGHGSEGLKSEGHASEGHASEGHGSEGHGSEGLRSEGQGSDDHESATTPVENDHADEHAGAGHSHGGADPHYWMSPKEALIMAEEVEAFLAELNPASAEKYATNLIVLKSRINEVDSLVRAATGTMTNRTVLIYHPALAYMGRDYGFEQISFEDEGKNPSPARLKELIDLARVKGIKTIFIQAEYDLRNAGSLSRETGARLIVINPMNQDWPEAVTEVANRL